MCPEFAFGEVENAYLEGNSVALEKPSLLVLEDSSTQASIISRMFREEGADVEVVTSAREFSTSPKLFDLKIDAAVIDVHFGEVNGLELIEPLLRRWRGITLVMMTANDTDDYAVLAKARELGAHLVLKKPFARAEVTTVLEDIRVISKTGAPRKHVVVIDDSRTTCRIIKELLQSYGFRVSTFTNGQDAIQQLSFDRVDAVLTDVNMPGMPGTELICLVRDVWRDVAIIAMSGESRAELRCKQADAFVPKPFGPEELVSKVRGVIGAEFEHLEC
ncbi:MAG: response regulator [Ponticaulis sp.]|nr:response regulator [Ponticaulis sp.]